MLRNVGRLCISHQVPPFLIIKRGKRIGRIIGELLQPSKTPIPPYTHVCQVGDPVLRSRAQSVKPEDIGSEDLNKVIDCLIYTMRSYDAYGLAAPQIGVSAQIFAIETTKKHVEECVKDKNAGQQVEVVPLRVFINPKMKILDYHMYAYPEACASIYGLIAHVPRAKTIQIEALDAEGKSFTWKADGWPAKLAQHEMDHLQGKLFTDKMEPHTLSCAIWSVVNQARGRVAMKFFPERSRWAKIKGSLFGGSR